MRPPILPGSAILCACAACRERSPCWVRSDRRGFYHFQELPSGWYVVSAWDRNDVEQEQRVCVAADHTVVADFFAAPVSLEPTSVDEDELCVITGRVVRQGTSTRIPNVGAALEDREVDLPCPASALFQVDFELPADFPDPGTGDQGR